MIAEFFDLLPKDWTHLQWLVLAVCAVFVGVSKTGLPGIGIMVVPVLASFFPAKSSTGLLLPLLAAADLFAVCFYRRHGNWRIILRLLPAALAGIAAGSVVICRVDDGFLRIAIGVIIFLMLFFRHFSSRQGGDSPVSSHWLYSVLFGFLAGLTTQLANAAGPVMTVYLLSMGLAKYEFIGTGAWYFMIVNWLKLPVFFLEGRITAVSLCADIVVLPFIAVGAAAGFFILKKLPQRWFSLAVEIFAAAAAAKLLFF